METTESAVKIEGTIRNDLGNSSISLDVTPIVQKIDYQNQLIFLGDILLVAILFFLAFRQALRGFWK